MIGVATAAGAYSNEPSMANKAGAVFGSEVPATACGPTIGAATTEAGACKTAELLFVKLGMKMYKDQTTVSNMFANNAWDAAGTGTASS